MGLIVVILLLALLFGGLGFMIHLLWFVAAIIFVFWLIGFAVGRGASAGSRGWYRW